MLVFLVKILYMLRRVFDVSLADGGPGISNKGINGLGCCGILWRLRGWGLGVGAKKSYRLRLFVISHGAINVFGVIIEFGFALLCEFLGMCLFFIKVIRAVTFGKLCGE